MFFPPRVRRPGGMRLASSPRAGEQHHLAVRLVATQYGVLNGKDLRDLLGDRREDVLRGHPAGDEGRHPAQGQLLRGKPHRLVTAHRLSLLRCAAQRPLRVGRIWR